MMENSKATLTNRLLLLWLINDVTKKEAIGPTKTQKLAYLSQVELIKKLSVGFNYTFKKRPYGPFSYELENDLYWLEENDFITSEPYLDGKIFHNSEWSKNILSDFKDMFERNNEIIKEIATINNKYASHTSFYLVDVIHKQKHPFDENITIHDIPLDEYILHPFPANVAKHKFVITPEEEETLDIYLDKQAYESVRTACKSAQTEPFLPLSEVF